MVTVLIADDEALIRAGLRAMIEASDDLSVIGEAKDGLDAVEQTRLKRPDVVLMDIRMPGLDGIEATRRLVHEHRVDSRVLVVTTYDMDDNVFEALRAGASGFLLKDSSPEQLAAAVHTVASGEALLAPTITRRLIGHFVRQAQPSVDDATRLEALTEREREVLLLLARGLSNREMAEALFLSEATVKTHVTRVLGKLDLASRTQAVVFSYEAGLVQPGTTT